MKKILAIALVLVMMLSLAVFASAEETEELSLTGMLKYANADFTVFSTGACPFEITGAGTYTVTLENITETHGTGLAVASMLYIEVEGGYAALKDYTISDVSVVVDGEAIAVAQEYVWTYESLGADYLPNGNYCIELYNVLGYSGAGYGAAIDPAINADESIAITFTLNAPVVEEQPAAPTVEDGQYVISWGELTFGALAEDKTYGYPYAGDVNNLTDTDYITITNVGDGQFTMQDCYGRYIYMIGTYNSFNVGTEMPTEGYLWVLEEVEGGFYLKNVEKEKYIAYSEQYTSWGCYASTSETSVLALTAVNQSTPDPNPNPNPPTGDIFFAVLAVMVVSGLGLTAVVSKKK